MRARVRERGGQVSQPAMTPEEKDLHRFNRPAMTPEEKDLRRLEKLLKMKKRKTLPAAFKADGLDCILLELLCGVHTHNTYKYLYPCTGT